WGVGWLRITKGHLIFSLVAYLPADGSASAFEVIFRPVGAWISGAFYPRLAPWAAFSRRSAAKWQAVFHRVGGISVLGHALRQRNWEVQQLVRIRDFSKAPATPDFSGVLNLAEVRNRIPRAETPLVRKPADWFSCFSGSL